MILISWLGGCLDGKESDNCSDQVHTGVDRLRDDGNGADHHPDDDLEKNQARVGKDRKKSHVLLASVSVFNTVSHDCFHEL